METCDVAVIGGGMAGVSIAWELAVDHAVVLLEKEDQLAVHTTGRSAAVYIPTYGNETVRALTRSSRGDFDRLADELGTPPLLSPRRLLWLSRDLGPEVRQAMVAGGGTPVDVDIARSLCPVVRPDRVAAAAVGEAMDVDVMALHGGYVRGLAKRGGRVVRERAVGRILRRSDCWEVHFPGGAIAATTVVNAAGAWADVVAQQAGQRALGMRPLRRTVFTTPVDGHDSARWPLVMDVGEHFYFKPEGAGLLVSPVDETPVEPGHDRHDALDIARAIHAVNEMTSLDVRHVSSIWSGVRTFAPDRSPVVGESPEAPGFFWFAGQGGYGIQMAPALARAGAALVRGRSLPTDIAAEGVTEHVIRPQRFHRR
jgi:D-arginine dehydrogenase